MSWGDLDTEVKAMNKEETEEKFEAKHSWLCNGIVLKLDDPAADGNIELFKVSFQYFLI